MNDYMLAFERINNRPYDEDGMVTLPLLLMDEQVIFPYLVTSVNISDEESQDTATGITQEGVTGLALYVDDEDALETILAQQPFGTEVALTPFMMRPAEEFILLAQGRRRLQIMSATHGKNGWTVQARLVEDELPDVDDISASMKALKALFAQITDYDNSVLEDVAHHIEDLSDPVRMCYELATVSRMDVVMQQRLLETVRLDEMIEQIRFHMSLQLVRFETHERINNRVQDKAAYEQRRVYLQEQLEAIQTELGADEFSQGDLGKLQQAIREATMPEDVEARAQEELKRLAQMPMMTPEATVVRGYLEWLTSIPWQAETDDNLDLAHAETVLNKAHFGLEKVKERIIEYIAVRKLAKDKMKSPILCFVGPPGVGKTSLGRSIAEALGREFVRVSLGGIRDEAEIRGHRRTYIGSMPGRIIQTMKRAGTTNPVFMLDEIDKLSEDYRGDPASALLEVLDPEQNQEFVDHYLEVPYDLSRTLFIATANDLYPLPEALEDRMEVIEFRSYTEEEKLEIARRFLIPKQLEAHGIDEAGVQFQPEALRTMIRQYTMEAGVRNLEREIANVCRKITRLVAMEKSYPRRITSALVEKYLGPPYIIPTRANREDSIGNVTGLVWTASGGDIQNVEISLLTGKGSLTMTGQLGDVLQESAQAAMSYMRSQAEVFDVDSEDFEDFDIHIHLPEGAVPKDGPSAGITLACGIVSIFTERRVRSQYAMTGEITLRGYVLPVGGVKEKVLAARRYGISDVILPADNKKDLVDIPKAALKDLRIHFVSRMQEVIDLVLHPAPEVRERDLKRQQEEENNAEEAPKPAKKPKKSG